jgi:hypothetical protein
MRTWAGGGATAGRPPRPRHSLAGGSTGLRDTRYECKKNK